MSLIKRFDRKLRTRDDEIVGAVAQLMGGLLHEPASRSIPLARQWLLTAEQSRSDWQWLSRADAEEIRPRVTEIRVPDERILRSYLRRQSRGVVLATLHMGDYLNAILRLLGLLGRKNVLFLRRRSETELEMSVFETVRHYGYTFDVARQGDQAAGQVYRALRRGAVAVLPFDLSNRWGRTLELTVLDQAMHWVVGPVALAMRSKSLLVPFFAHSVSGETTCVVDALEDFSVGRSHGSQTAVAQRLADLASVAIRSTPTQWHHWHVVPEMVAPAHG